MSVSEAQKRATTKYESKNYKKICLRLPATEGQSALYDKTVIAADRARKSLNAFILVAIAEKIARIEADPEGQEAEK